MALTIKLLLENRCAAETDGGLVAKNGLSLLISDEHNALLFDTGPDGSFQANAAAMGISLDNLSAVVLSHGDDDHCGGVPWLKDHTHIICHPDLTRRATTRGVPDRLHKIRPSGADINYSRFNMEYHRDPCRIGERFMWSGEIAKATVPAHDVRGDESAQPDCLDDEGALIYLSERGLVIFTGGGENGVINIVRHCQRVTGITRVHALVGGFNLYRASPWALWRLRRFLRQLRPDAIIACHCTGRWGRLWLPECLYPATGSTLVLH